MKQLQTLVMGRYFWAISLLIFALSRVATWFFPYDSDHWIFFYIGKMWAHGGTLYVDMWDHKSPLIFAFNGFLSLFGDSIVIHRLILTGLALVGLWLFYVTAQKLYAQLKLPKAELWARLSTLLFAFFANLSQFTNSGNNNENLGIVALLATLYCYLSYKQSSYTQRGYLLAAGAFAGTVVFLKANFALLVLPIVIDLTMQLWRRWQKLCIDACVFALAPLIQALAWANYFVDQHTFKDFVIASFTFNSKYMKALGWDLHAPGIAIFLGILALLVAFFVPFAYIAIRRAVSKPRSAWLFVGMLAAASVLFMLALGTFYSHYYLVVIPYLCLVAGATAQYVLKKRTLLILGALLGICAIMYVISLRQLYNNFQGSVAAEATNQRQVADYLRRNSDKNDTIFAYVYGATMYQLAQRDSGSRFVSASHPLIDYKFDFGYEFNRKFIEDMEASQTPYVVMSNDPDDLYRQKNRVLMAYFRHRYEPVAVIGSYEIWKRVDL